MTAQVVTNTEVKNPQGLQTLVCDWACTDLGVVATTSSYSYTGQIVEVLFVPDTAGTAPDDLYDVTITDGTYDLLFGQGANLSGTLSVALLGNLGYVNSAFLTIAIAGAGDANGGVITVVVKEP